MRKLAAAAFLIFIPVIAPQIAQAQQTPRAISSDSRIRQAVYSPDNGYHIEGSY